MKRGKARARSGRLVEWTEQTFELEDAFTLRQETWTPPATKPAPSQPDQPQLFSA